MVLRKTTCLKRLGGDRAGEESIGRFFANAKVTAAKIIESWGVRTGPAAAGRHALAIQDTTEVKFPTTAGRGLGPCGHGNAHGILAHVMLAVDAASSACLGLVDGEIWNRPGNVTVPPHHRAPEKRESRRWVDTAERAKAVLAPAAMITMIGDRENDFYAMWVRFPEPGVHLLTRAQQDRLLTPDGTAGGGAPGKLFAAAAAFPVAATRRLELPARRPDRARRTAEVELRFGTVAIARPVIEKDVSLPKTVRLHVVEVKESNPPDGADPIHWRLLTTHEVNTAANAWQIVAWYQVRWTIEQWFRVTKSQGLGLEESQVATAERLIKLTAAALKAACMDMQLVQERDGTLGLPASHGFTEPEIDTIEALNPVLEGKTKRQQNPHPPRSLARARWVMARLGGWNCYYGPPGPIVMHRGVERFHAIHAGR
jgi:hypothetical protein